MTEILHRGMEEAARDLQLDFRTGLSILFESERPPWDGPGQGSFRNMMHGKWRGGKVWVFDFPLVSDSDGDVKPEDIRTGICISNEAIQWPKTKISPYGTVDRFAGLVFRDNSKACEEAGPRFVVEGDDPHWPGLADERLKNFLNEHGNLEISIRPGVLSIHRTQDRVEPYEVEDYLEHARQLQDIVVDTPEQAESGFYSDSTANRNTFLRTSQRSKADRLAAAIVALLIMMFCGYHLRQAYRQWKAANFAETDCWMKVVEFDEGALSAMVFQYQVNGTVYTGGANDRRLVWRPFRIGDDKAQRLKVKWRQGARATLFYDPNNPEVGILDNSFTTGDGNFVKLLLAVCGVCMIVATWPLFDFFGKRILAAQLRGATPIEGTSQIRYPLPRAPYALDTLVFALVPFFMLAFAWSFTLVVEPGKWLQAVHFWLIVLILVNIAIVPLLYLLERWWRGRSGDYLIAIPISGQLMIPRPGRDLLKISFDQIRSIRLRETHYDNDTMSVMNGYDPIVTYADQYGHRTEVMVTRYFSREFGRRCVYWLRTTTGLSAGKTER